MLASVAGEPSDKSVPLPLSLNTLAVVPPDAESIGDELKSSF